MPFYHWEGFVQPFLLGTAGGAVPTEQIFDESLNNPVFHDGDKIVRWLIGFRFDTRLVDNIILVDEHPQALSMSVIYLPTPDGEGSAVDLISGDAIWKGATSWHPRYWTDGSVNSTGWYAGTEEWINIKAERDIVDKTVAEIQIGSSIDPYNGFEGHSTVPFTAEGWINVRYLVKVP